MAGPWEEYATAPQAPAGPWTAYAQQPAPAQPSITDAITDIPAEIGKAAGEALTNIKGIANRGGQGPIEGLLTTGKAVLGVPQLLMSPITGAARSVLGHGLEQATHAAGSVIAPEIAAKEDRQKNYETAKGDVDLAMTAAAPGKVRAPAVKPPTIQELKSAAKADYNSPEVTSLEVQPTTIKQYGGTAKSVLNNEGFDENVAPKTFGILSKLETIPSGATVTGQNFNSLRKMLGKAAGSIEPAEKAAASIAIEHLDSFIPAIPKRDVIAGDVVAAAEKLETARANYSAAKQAEKIDQKLVSAEIRAGAVNAGQNVAGKIRQNMAGIADPTTPRNARGMLPEEVDAARRIAEGTPVQNALRNVGDALGGGGGIRAGVLGVGGAILGGAPGAAIPLVGHALRAISNKLTVRQAEKLSEMIRSRAPLASSAQKYNQAAAAVQANRTPQAIAGAVLAARNLSTNMRSAGFNISPSDLFNGLLQSPARSNAADQEQVPGPPGQ